MKYVPLMMGRCTSIAGVTREDGWYIGPESGPVPMLDIAQVHLTASQDAGEQEAWARLFVGSPDLLAALERVVSWVDAGCDPSTKSLAAARAAITKVRGVVNGKPRRKLAAAR